MMLCAVSSAPKAVRGTDTAGAKHFYEIEVKVGEATHALKIDEAGKLLADEIVKVLPVDEKTK